MLLIPIPRPLSLLPYLYLPFCFPREVGAEGGAALRPNGHITQSLSFILLPEAVLPEGLFKEACISTGDILGSRSFYYSPASHPSSQVSVPKRAGNISALISSPLHFSFFHVLEPFGWENDSPAWIVLFSTIWRINCCAGSLRGFAVYMQNNAFETLKNSGNPEHYSSCELLRIL